MTSDAKKKTPNPVDVQVGARLRMRRTMMSMSQERLGEQLGITFQQIQKYEKGTNRIGASRLQNIAEVLDVPVSFFFDGQEAARPRDQMSEHGRAWLADGEGDADFEALQAAFRRIAEPGLRRHVVELVRALADRSTAAGSGRSKG